MSHAEPAHLIEQQPLIRALRAANVCFTRIYHRLRVITPCPLPPKGPAIMVCNHISGLDPAMLQSLTRRLIVWMTAREFVERAELAWLFRAIRAIPVSRDKPDLSAMRQALRALEAGQVLGIFPEGGISDSRQLLPFQPGAALLAQRSGVPVFPAAIEGTQRGHEIREAYLIPQQAVVAFGPPLPLDASLSVEQATQQVRSAVERVRQSLIRLPLEKNSNKINILPGK
jgi:1-acyl-sn-glycerol-3-phosphate acyltransferase